MVNSKERIGGNEMKATLKFNLPEDQAEFNCASQGMNIMMAIQDVDAKLRDIIKYQSENHPVEVVDFAEEMRADIRDKLFQYGINIDII